MFFFLLETNSRYKWIRMNLNTFSFLSSFIVSLIEMYLRRCPHKFHILDFLNFIFGFCIDFNLGFYRTDLKQLIKVLINSTEISFLSQLLTSIVQNICWGGFKKDSSKWNTNFHRCLFRFGFFCFTFFNSLISTLKPEIHSKNE